MIKCFIDFFMASKSSIIVQKQIKQLFFWLFDDVFGFVSLVEIQIRSDLIDSVLEVLCIQCHGNSTIYNKIYWYYFIIKNLSVQNCIIMLFFRDDLFQKICIVFYGNFVYKKVLKNLTIKNNSLQLCISFIFIAYGHGKKSLSKSHKIYRSISFS